jgi:hypothetical protein
MSQSVVKPIRPEESVGGALQWEYILSRLIGKTYTATLVKVNDVKPGGVGPVGFLSATDLIQQTDGNNDGIANEPMENMPYFRLQGGANAIVIDPKPGDIGIALFARRDITVAKQNKSEGPPPSLRTHDVSDGLYIGGILNGAPSQWIRFLDSGVNITSTGPLSVDATVLQVNCPIISTGDITDKTNSMQAMREQYNTHIGHAPSGGSSPSVPME